MRKACILLFCVFCWAMVSGQNRPLHRVVVVMNEQYNPMESSRKTSFMDKAQRRDFVINEHKAFCQASQAEVTRFLGSLKGEVEDLHPFWSFNGLACKATDEVIQLLERRNDVALVYKDELRRMLPDNEKAYPTETKDLAWHVEKVNAPAVWNYNGTGYTGNGVVVAVLDTGVNYNHIDMAGCLWDGGTEYPHHGYDVVNHDDDPIDDHGHGSHCAGIVAGQGTAGTQTGVAPGAKVMAVKIMNAEGAGGDAELLGGIEFALEHGADILSCSFGDAGVGGYNVYRQAYETVLEAGVVAAVAAGNDGQTQYACPIPYNIESPGNCPPPWFHPDQTLRGGRTAVVSIGATDSNDSHSDFSSVGPATWAEGAQIGEYNDYPYENGNAAMPGLIRPDVSAPGSNITSLNYATNDGYIAHDGTSMATPCAAGVMALLLEADPELSPAELDSIIELTAVKIGNPKKNNITGSGRIDALAAVNALFFHGPTNLTANNNGGQGNNVIFHWDAVDQAVSYSLYRDGVCISNNLTNTYTHDVLQYAGSYTYYVTAQLSNGLLTLPSNYVTVNYATIINVQVFDNSIATISWNLPSALTEDFESGGLNQNLWFNDATSPWVITTTDPHSGNYCVKSVNTAMFSSSKISLAVSNEISTTVSYNARISCFPLNGGGFFIDNVQQGETIKDEVPWTRYSFPLSPGNHLLEWKYANQLAEGEYDNAFYIDDIQVGNLVDLYRRDCDSDTHTHLVTTAEPGYYDEGWDALPIGHYQYGVSTDGGLNIFWSDCIDKDYMAVDETTEITEARHLTITTLLGQVLYDGPVNIDLNTLQLEGYPAGVYLVHLLTDKGTVTKKVCVTP
jgi:subtilisin family serine protease